MRIPDMFIRLLDFVFPPSAELNTVRTLRTHDIPYLFHERNIHNSITLSDFRNPKTRALIHEAKFHGNEHAFDLLCRLFLMHLESSGNQYDIIVPIPLSPARKRARGYNQVEEILKHATHHRSLSTNSALLVRTRNTKPQTDLPKQDRLKNLTDAFKVLDPSLVTSKRLLLVDDVLTTGATLDAAYTALLPHRPTSITRLALAH